MLTEPSKSDVCQMVGLPHCMFSGRHVANSYKIEVPRSSPRTKEFILKLSAGQAGHSPRIETMAEAIF